jgi:hypothetical protein
MVLSSVSSAAFKPPDDMDAATSNATTGTASIHASAPRPPDARIVFSFDTRRGLTSLRESYGGPPEPWRKRKTALDIYRSGALYPPTLLTVT